MEFLDLSLIELAPNTIIVSEEPVIISDNVKGIKKNAARIEEERKRVQYRVGTVIAISENLQTTLSTIGENNPETRFVVKDETLIPNIGAIIVYNGSNTEAVDIPLVSNEETNENNNFKIVNLYTILGVVKK
jgi:hypothetical protein